MDLLPAYYFISPSNDPLYNIALEDFLYQQRRDIDRIYMLWVNTPSVFMGRYQSAKAETNHDYLVQENIPILRRLSGGGAVYHDLGNLNYTCISNDRLGRGFDMRQFPQPIISAMKSQGVELTLSPRGDLRYQGLKVGGSAEATRRGRMLYHMSLLFDADLSELEHVLTAPQDVSERSRVASVRSQVTNLRPLLRDAMDMNGFQDLLLKHIRLEYSNLIPLTVDTIVAEAYIKEAIESKYSADEWTYSPIGTAPKSQKA